MIIKRAASILNAGGMIAIEYMVRGRSPIAQMFAINMFVNTESGHTYTEKSTWNGSRVRVFVKLK